MDIIEKAIIFAANAHKNQVRKSTTIPYITHPFTVGMLLKDAKCSDEVIVAGILHDTLEDTPTTYEELDEQFGTHVANLVQSASENDKSLSWEVRKQHTIEQLKEADLEAIQVISADKLHNLKSIQADLEQHGDDVWNRFNRGKRDQHWYYSSIVNALKPRKKEFKLIAELEKVVKEVFGSLEIFTNDEMTSLFSCVYSIDEKTRQSLKKYGLLSLAEKLTAEAEQIYKNEYHSILSKLDDFQSRGISFQSNSEGPFILVSYCIALQRYTQWSDQEIYKYTRMNLK
jgi:(p)ppGpp synthase/HD superfamily hydrolase